jgi:ADP-heptose:LPS heptosyltransferase
MLNRLKGFLYTCTGLLARLQIRKKTSQKLLIVRVDEIGDYMLWRPFFHELVNADMFKDHEIHFCGNSSWKALFDSFDKGIVHQSTWLQKQRFKKELLYRLRFLRNIYKEHYSVVINPTYSRDKRNDDSIVAAASAGQRIGMVANQESVRSYETGYDKNLYTKLFDCTEKPVFEFYRNRLFTEFVTGHTSSVQNTWIDTTNLPLLPSVLPEKYFVVFPGSRSSARIWPAENFVRVSNYIFETYGWTAIVCGTKNDAVYIEAFCKQYKYPVINLTGKTSLTEMLSLLKNAQCLLSVDTGSVHLAVAVRCTVFGIFNGSQYKRFAPYPSDIASNFHAVYPDDVEKELQDAELVKQKYEFVIRVPYASVKPEKLIHAIYNHYTK